MKKYLICYYIVKNGIAVDLESIIESDNIREALDEFILLNVFDFIHSISQIVDVNYTPDFNLKK